MARHPYDVRILKSGKRRYTTVVDVPTPDGRRKQRRLTADSPEKLSELVTRTKREIHTGTYVEPSTDTLATYLTEWLNAVESTIRPSTAHVYETIITTHIRPALGGIVLARLTPLSVQAYYTDKLKSLAPATVRQHHAILHRALDRAVKWGLLARNVCDAVEPPTIRPPALTVWTGEQARVFLAGSAGHRLGPLFAVALATGMRMGELLALRWADLDLDRGRLTVTRTLTRDRAGSWTIGEPKSVAGRRGITLPAGAVAALRRHRTAQLERMLRQRDTWQALDLVFDAGDGSLLMPSTVKKVFVALTERQGLPRLRFHDLRHTSATLALEAGVPVKAVSERLGHSDVAMTLSRYAHVTESVEREAADRLAMALGI
jgi:integrase